MEAELASQLFSVSSGTGTFHFTLHVVLKIMFRGLNGGVDTPYMRHVTCCRS